MFLLPEDPRLTHPTVGEVAAALGAEFLHGPPRPRPRTKPTVRRRSRGRTGRSRSSWSPPCGSRTFLEHLEDGALVVTPGDREDILLASLAGDRSRTGPDIAGVLLTGGPAARGRGGEVGRAGLAAVPVLGVAADTFATATGAAAVPATLSPDAPRQVEAALELFDAHVDGDALAGRVRLSNPGRVTPLMFEYDLLRRAAADRRHVVLPEGAEPRILRAAETILRRGVARLTLLGEETAVREKIAELKLDEGLFAGVPVLDPAADPLRDEFAAEYLKLREHKGVTADVARDRMADVSYFGTMMVHLGRADGMVSGSCHTTAHTIRPAFEFIKTKPGVGVVSGAFLMLLADRVLVYADCAVVPEPTVGQLAEIAVTSADTAARFGVDPRVALLSYSTGESGAGEEVDRVRAATAKAQELRPDLPIDGPMQYDAAVDPRRPPPNAPAARGRPGDGADLPGPQHRQQHLQGGPADGRGGRRRAGLAGPEQAGQRFIPRLHGRGRGEHGGDHRGPGAGDALKNDTGGRA